MHSSRIEPLERGEWRNLAMKRIERGLLVVARMHQQGLTMAERHIGESLGRIVEEGTAGKRQGADEAVAKRKVKHRRASPGGMKADLFLGFEQRHAGMFGKRSGCG